MAGNLVTRAALFFVLITYITSIPGNLIFHSLPFHQVPEPPAPPPEVNSLLQKERNPYHHKALPDPRYSLEWTVDWPTRQLFFNVTVSTTGYVGLGLSQSGTMANGDMVVGGVDSRTGVPYLTDMHGAPVGNTIHRDDSQDYTLISAWENATHTSIRFSRAFDTCDQDDLQVNADDSVVLTWCFGDDDKVVYHYQNRGTYNAYLLAPDWTPNNLQQPSQPGGNYISGNHHAGGDDNLRLWTITRRQRVPSRDTAYWCSFHKGPVLQRKHHAVGFNFRWETPIQFSHTHHMLLFKCKAPPGQDPVEFFEPYIRNNTGDMCFFPAVRGYQEGGSRLPTEFCREVVFPYAIGSRIFFFPSHVGLAIGETAHEYYLLQVHHDNPNRVHNLEYTINMDIYYTAALRPHEAGIITVGHHIPGMPTSILLPPSSISYQIWGHCGAECTKEMVPPEGIRIFAVQQHTHNSGYRHRIHQYRGNTELPWVANDDNYNNGFQSTRMLRNEVLVLPGDHLATRCLYDNTWGNGSAVVGGFSTRQEMCLAYIW